MKDFMKKEREKLSMQEHRGEMSIDEEQKLKKKVLKGNWGIAKDKASIHASMEKVQSYEEAFAKIQAATGISDIDELVTTFINAEDQNFALFNYVNELNAECEKLEEQIADIKSEIEKYKGQVPRRDGPPRCRAEIAPCRRSVASHARAARRGSTRTTSERRSSRTSRSGWRRRRRRRSSTRRSTRRR